MPIKQPFVEAKGHAINLKPTQGPDEGVLLSVLVPHWDMLVAASQIQGGEELGLKQ